MIPPLFVIPLSPAAEPGVLTLELPGGGTTIGVSASNGEALITFTYDYPGEPTDEIALFVSVNGGAAQHWGVLLPGGADYYTENETYGYTETGWIGVGTYVVTAAARRISTGNFDVFGNTVTITGL